MKKRTSPTERTLKELRKLGARVAIVERWNQFAHIRQDLWGFADLLAMRGPNIIAVQVTTGAHHAEHKAKILAEPNAWHWLKANGLIELWSWSEMGAKGEKKKWTARKEEIVPLDFVNGEPPPHPKKVRKPNKEKSHAA